jgi:hypothetical protein
MEEEFDRVISDPKPVIFNYTNVVEYLPSPKTFLKASMNSNLDILITNTPGVVSDGFMVNFHVKVREYRRLKTKGKLINDSLIDDITKEQFDQRMYDTGHVLYFKNYYHVYENNSGEFILLDSRPREYFVYTFPHSVLYHGNGMIAIKNRNNEIMGIVSMCYGGSVVEKELFTHFNE